MQPRTLRNWILLTPLAVLVWAGLLAACFAAAPTVVLDIPTPTATRISTCPVHAGIDIASSDPGESDTESIGGNAANGAGDDWSNTTGSEYAYYATLQEIDPALSGIMHIAEGAGLSDSELVRGTAGSLAAGEWDIVGGRLHIRLSDSSNPNSAASTDVTVYADYTWDMVRIMWGYEGVDGSSVDEVPDKYRYCRDPRPGLNNRQIDMTGNDTTNYNRPRGFNFGWVLVGGKWRIKAEATNPHSTAAPVYSSVITIAENTRTAETVGPDPEDDYATLAAALFARAATNDWEIVVDDGHTETITAALTPVSGDNFVIRQAGTGTRPNISWDGSGNVTVLVLTGENHVVDGLQFTETTGDNANNVADVNLCGVQASGAIVNCHVNGSSAGNYFREIFQMTGTYDGSLLLNCSCGYSERFSVSWGTGTQTIQSIIGGTYGASRDESTIRTTGSPDLVNTCWTDLTQDGLKSTLRYGSRNYLHAYGNRWEDGDNWCGIITGGGIAGSNVRIEANYATGTVSATGIIMGVKSGLSNATACNNIGYEGPIQLYLGFEADSFGDPKVNCRWLHNTLWHEDGRSKTYVFGRETVGDSTFGAGNAVSCNLFGHADGADITSRVSQLSDDIVAFVDNVFPATTPNAIALMEAFDSSGSPTYYDTAAEINAGETWASGNTEKDVTLDSSYVPSDPTSVTTASGVYDDYFGTARSSSSWAGAVGSEPASESTGVYQTFIPGVIARPAP